MARVSAIIYAILAIITELSLIQAKQKADLCADNSKEKFIIDTDAGSDDAVGIFLALGLETRNHIEVIAITTTQGNTNVDNVAINVLKILDTAERLEIPAYKGANYSILITPPSDNYFGNDGFGDFIYPNPPSSDLLQQLPAAYALIDLIEKCPGKYNLIFLGPTTNLALAIRLRPGILSKVNNVFIMGGSVNGHGNIKPGIEFNVYVDPEALSIVLSEAEKTDKVLYIFPLETGDFKVNISADWRLNVLGAVDNPVVKLLNQAESAQLGEARWNCYDALTVACAMEPSLITETIDSYMTSETCGVHSRGALFSSFNDPMIKPNVRIIAAVNQEQYKELLLSSLSEGFNYLATDNINLKNGSN